MDEFLAALQQGDDAACEAAVNALTPADEAALLALLDDADPDRRWWAVRALAQVGGGDAVPAVAPALADEDAGMRAVAALALGHMYTRAPSDVRRLLPNISALLADDDGLVRQVAGDALSMCGDDAVPVLADVLRGAHEGARTRAALALGKIATMPAAAVLYQHLNDPNFLVRSHAYEALDDMGLLENLLFTV